MSHNTALTRLLCHNNHLTELNVSCNTALTELDCNKNQLASLDLSKNTKLTTQNCGSNSRYITLSAENTFDLSTLPGFDLSKASNFAGGNVSEISSPQQLTKSPIAIAAKMIIT